MENRWFFKAKRKDFGEWVFGGLAYCEKMVLILLQKWGKTIYHISVIFKRLTHLQSASVQDGKTRTAS